jgi:hypothetical protein
LVSADKVCNNIVFVCKAHYYQCIINKLGINSTISNRTYILTTFSKDEILQNHAFVLNTLTFTGHVDDDSELPYLHFIQKLHKTPYKKDSLPVPKILIAVKERLQMYCGTLYARSGDDQMWILKNSQELLESLKSPIFSLNLQHQNL